MSRRNLPKDRKGHLKHEKAAEGWGGGAGPELKKIPISPGDKKSYLFFFCLFLLLAGGKKNKILQLFISWQ